MEGVVPAGTLPMQNEILGDTLSFPRIWSDGLSAPSVSVDVFPEGCRELARHFESVTGWKVDFEESRASFRNRCQYGDDASTVHGHLSICDMSADWPEEKCRASRKDCDALMASIDSLVSDLQSARQKNQTTEIESTCQNAARQFPAGLGQPSEDDFYRLSMLFSSLLNTGLDISGMNDAALYLLDDEAKTLITRCSVGTGEPTVGDSRSMFEAIADIEAMSGAVVMMQDRHQTRAWASPVDCASAICIPVASASTIFGTLWFFSDQEQEYSAEAVNMLEVLSGRLAAELELAAMRAIDIAEVDEIEFECGEYVFDEELDDPQRGNVDLSNLDRAERDCTSQFESLERGDGEIQRSLVQPPFDGWEVELNESNSSHVASWTVTTDEKLVAVCGRLSLESDSGLSLIFDRAMQTVGTTTGEGSTPLEILDSLEILLGRDEKSGLELACAVIDPLTGELEVACSSASSSIFISLCGDGEEPVRLCEGRSGVSGQVLFLTRGQSIVIGGTREEHDLLFSTQTPDLESLCHLLDRNGTAVKNLVSTSGRLILSRS